MNPSRLCVSCRQLFPREELHRLTYDKVQNKWYYLSPGKQNNQVHGRSAYVCSASDCMKAALKGRKLQRALKQSIPGDIVEQLESA